MNDITNFIKWYKPRPCFYCTGDKKERGIFHRWIDLAYPTGKSIICQSLALIELENGCVVQAQPKSVIFADSECLFKDFAWPEEKEN